VQPQPVERSDDFSLQEMLASTLKLYNELNEVNDHV